MLHNIYKYIVTKQFHNIDTFYNVWRKLLIQINIKTKIYIYSWIFYLNQYILLLDCVVS